LKPPEIDAEGIDEAVDGFEGVLFGDIAQMSISSGGSGAGVTE
jgi:hypothetical protein